MHVMAERAGVRMIVVDRPGMGGSTDVPLAKRFEVWVDLVPRLLAHLEIQRVSLASHSSGTMYLFNTWAKCRDFVNPVILLLGWYLLDVTLCWGWFINCATSSVC